MTIQIRRRRQINSPFLGGLVMILFGLGLTAILSRTVLKDAQASESWPTTVGVVTASELRSQRSGDGYTYSPRVVYEYSVDGEMYTSGRITVADGSSSRAEGAEAKVEQYAVGSEVAVYYDPDLPTEALLEVGAPTAVTWLYRGGWAFIVIGGLVLVRSLLRLVFGFLRVGI